MSESRNSSERDARLAGSQVRASDSQPLRAQREAPANKSARPRRGWPVPAWARIASLALATALAFGVGTYWLASAAGSAWLASTTGSEQAASAASTPSTGEASNPQRFANRGPRIVTTTGILADFAREVAGERANVSQMVPDGADPHSYEPSLRTVRDVAYADIAFSNYMLLEQHAIIRTLDANLPANAHSVSVAEESAKQGATILPLVEDRSLDTAWLGMSVTGTGAQLGATRSSTVDLTAVRVEGPGDAAGYLTTSFGTPEVAFASVDGFSPASGYAEDTAVLPAAAHQHMSWLFTKPGIYRVHFQAALRTTTDAPPIAMRAGTAVFAVGVDPNELAKHEGRKVLSAGHADLTVDLDAKNVALGLDSGTASLDSYVIEVPSRTLTTIPAHQEFRSIGRPGTQAYILPQAVLGKHVHGSIDPHLWHNVHNAQAYVRVIRDELSKLDPLGSAEYRKNAARYLHELDALDAEVSETIAKIEPQRRQLITTSDAYGYLAKAYGLQVAGFVAPNPNIEPSVADRIRLTTTISNLKVPAVFLEPNLARARSTLRTVAEDTGVRICPLYGDTLDSDAPTYMQMMRKNAQSLLACLQYEPSERMS